MIILRQAVVEMFFSGIRYVLFGVMFEAASRLLEQKNFVLV